MLRKVKGMDEKNKLTVREWHGYIRGCPRANPYPYPRRILPVTRAGYPCKEEQKVATAGV